MPGVLGGLLSVVAALVIPASAYGGDINAIVRQSVPIVVHAFEFDPAAHTFPPSTHPTRQYDARHNDGSGRTPFAQATFQLLALFVTLCTYSLSL